MLTAQEGLETQVFLCLAQLILFRFFFFSEIYRIKSRLLCTGLNFLHIFKHEARSKIQYCAVLLAVRIFRD